MEPPLWLTLACASREVVRKQLDWAGSFAQNDRNGRGSLKMGVASKILRALRAHPCNRTPLQEILDSPLDSAQAELHSAHV